MNDSLNIGLACGFAASIGFVFGNLLTAFTAWYFYVRQPAPPMFGDPPQ